MEATDRSEKMAQVYQSPIHGRMMDYDCDIKNTAKKNWDCCDLKQYCAKLDTLNKQAQKKDPEGRRILTRNQRRRMARNSERGEGRFREEWGERYGPGKSAPPKSMFYHECAWEKARKNQFEIGKEMQADHVHELQLGGHATHQRNFKWLSSSVNGSLGSTLSNYQPKLYPGGVSATCCPAEEQECRDKKDTDKLV
jgi:hypothetical protein